MKYHPDIHLFNASFFIILVATVTTLLLSKIPFLEPISDSIIEWDFTDLYYRNNPEFEKINIDTNVIIANISKFNRYEIAKFLDEINKFNPKVVGVDVFFSNKNNNTDDSLLKDALGKTKNLVMATTIIADSLNIESDGFIIRQSHPFFTQNATSGLVNLVHDDKNVLRSFFIYENDLKTGRTYSFSIEILKHFNPDKIMSILLKNNVEEIIKYQGRMENYYIVDYNNENQLQLYTINRNNFGWETLETNKSPEFIKDKIVLLGFMGTKTDGVSFENLFYTPLRTEYLSFASPDMYGVAIQANIISMYLNNDNVNPFQSWSNYYNLLILLLFLFVSKLLHAKFKVYNQLGDRGLSLLVIFILIYFSVTAFGHNIYFNFTLAVFWILFAIDANELYRKIYEPIFAKSSRATQRIFILTPLLIFSLSLLLSFIRYITSSNDIVLRFYYFLGIMLIYFVSFFIYGQFKKSS